MTIVYVVKTCTNCVPTGIEKAWMAVMFAPKISIPQARTKELVNTTNSFIRDAYRIKTLFEFKLDSKKKPSKSFGVKILFLREHSGNDNTSIG